MICKTNEGSFERGQTPTPAPKSFPYVLKCMYSI